jgi:hypothetical protein
MGALPPAPRLADVVCGALARVRAPAMVRAVHGEAPHERSRDAAAAREEPVSRSTTSRGARAPLPLPFHDVARAPGDQGMVGAHARRRVHAAGGAHARG